MNGIKIVDLPNSTLPYTGTERIPITQDGQTRNGTLSSISDAFWETFRPNVLEIDYIELADQPYVTIPPNSLARRGDIVYLGETAITPYKEYRVAGNRISNGSVGRTLIAKLPITGSLLPQTGDGRVRFKFDLFINANYQTENGFVLWFDFDNSPENMTSGIYVVISKEPTSIVSFDGDLIFPVSGNKLMLDVSNGFVSFSLGSNPNGLLDGPITGKVLTVGVDISQAGGDGYIATPNESNHINIYIQETGSNTVGESVAVDGIFGVGGTIELNPGML